MSNNEIGQITGTICQQDITMVAGFALNVILGNVIQPFTLGTSRIIGIKGKTLTLAGVAFQKIGSTAIGLNLSAIATPQPITNALTIAQVLAGQCPATFVSALIGDTNVYTVYWYNQVGAGLNSC